ncbi:MAG: FAD-dependent monooxygenase [Muribaculaceae bacterium]|nr:FAD-dependent monooxygenase [Muribaculaceae bacterium]
MPDNTIQLRVTPEIAYNPLRLKADISTRLGVDVNRIKHIQITKRSIDARQRQVMVNLTVEVYLDRMPDVTESLAKPETYNPLPADAPSAIVVGAGPAGLFAALRLIQEGVRPILLERGKNVADRGKDMARIARENIVDPDSNYCFGEGGAGAYSDGKLYTRSKKRGPVDKILNILVQHGAKEDILVDAHPHIGTDRLPQVIKAIRETILRCGGIVRFETRVDRLIISDGKVNGVVTSTGEEIYDPVILATGHSARDVYRFLDTEGVKIEPKGIAVGVRVEHSQQLIDSIQYHNPKGRGQYLPPAEYSMLTRVKDRAVYSFCMCPGGFIIPAATAPGQLVVNGMSPASRGSKWANSGMVVEVLPEDLGDYDKYGNLKVMKFQEDIEKRFAEDAGNTQNAPAQRLTDFVNGQPSATLPSTSYAPGIHPARIDKLLPPIISDRLREGFREFGRKSKGYLTDRATVIGAETRTSSPVRIPRDKDTLCHIEIAGLYPCGEGAGYAGGIVSAAIDGDRCAQSLAQSLTE